MHAKAMRLPDAILFTLHGRMTVRLVVASGRGFHGHGVDNAHRQRRRV